MLLAARTSTLGEVPFMLAQPTPYSHALGYKYCRASASTTRSTRSVICKTMVASVPNIPAKEKYKYFPSPAATPSGRTIGLV